MRIAVVGGGIAGLSATYFLRKRGHDAFCIDRGPHAGGLMRSERHDGFLCEAAPQALLDGEATTLKLIATLGLQDRMVRASKDARVRRIYVQGKLRTLPIGPLGLFTTDVLSWRGRLRLLREPWVPKRVPTPSEPSEESVLAFAERRLGKEAAHNLVAPFVLGVFAGDAARLSVVSALPRLATAEARSGSLLRGLRAAKREGHGAGKVFSFIDGLAELPRALAAALESNLASHTVERVSRSGLQWRIDVASPVGGTPVEPIFAGRLVLATSPAETSRLLRTVAPAASAAIDEIPLAPAVVVTLGFRRQDIGVDLKSYGFLVARGEGIATLGCQYESTIFPGRAPAGCALLRTIHGGVFDPQAVSLSDDDLVARSVDDLSRVAGLNAKADFRMVFRYPAAIPQYEIGHQNRLARMEAEVAKWPGLYLLGYAFKGIGVNDQIRTAAALADAWA